MLTYEQVTTVFPHPVQTLFSEAHTPKRTSPIKKVKTELHLDIKPLLNMTETEDSMRRGATDRGEKHHRRELRFNLDDVNDFSSHRDDR